MDKTYETTQTDLNREHPVYENIATDDFGHPIGDNQHSLRAGRDGPMLISDTQYLRKMARFNRERIPPRNVHAQGVGAHGYLEITKDISKYCKADVFSEIGKKTPLFLRFSSVRLDPGDNTCMRDPRGFAIKHYTNEGIWDMVANNLPVFFVRDGIKFPDFIATQKRSPKDGLYHYDEKFDFWSLIPHSAHMWLMLFSPRGTPASFRQMHGFGAHTFVVENAEGRAFYVKFHYMSQNGIKNFTQDEVDMKGATDPEYLKRELINHLQSGKTAEWKACLQVMPIEEADDYEWDVLDITKVWPHKDYPLMEYGRLVLTRPADNHFKETEQVAFCPANMVPGIYPSNDPMLHSRLQSYEDTQRYRLGPLFHQIPINAPINRTNTYTKNGRLEVTDNNNKVAYMEPNTMGGPREAPQFIEYPLDVKPGKIGRWGRSHMRRSEDYDFIQPRRLLLEVMTEKDRQLTKENLVGELNKVTKHAIVVRFLKVLSRVDLDFAASIGKSLTDQVTRKEIEECLNVEDNIRLRTAAYLEKMKGEKQGSLKTESAKH